MFTMVSRSSKQQVFVALVIVSLSGLANGKPAKLPVTLLSHESTEPLGPVFKYKFEADNGVKEEREGSAGPEGTSIMKGSYSYLMDDGSAVVIKWTADENGYKAEGAAIPTPPPMPAHAIQQILFAEANPES